MKLRTTAIFREPKLQRLHVALALLLIGLSAADVCAFRVFNLGQTKPGFGVDRWDAAPRLMDGLERSLDGGLRYSLQGGSYEAFRDLFRWRTLPSVEDFQAAVDQAFDNWEVIDPTAGLGTAVRFVPDLETPVVMEKLPQTLDDYLQVNRGAEIDVFATSLACCQARADPFVHPTANSVTLTSGVTDYPAAVFSGADIRMGNDNPWDLSHFREVLSHEIGHVLGLGDVDVSNGFLGVYTEFYDDNFDNTNSSTARATLTNSFADLIDPIDPDNSPALMLYEPCDPFDPANHFACPSQPGLDTSGVNLHMETSPQSSTFQLQNDEFAGRQFLYPFVRIPGDFNADKILMVEDVDLLLDETGEPDPRGWFDLTGDELVDLNDRSAWVELRGTFVGDANLDEQVNAADLNALALNWCADDATSWEQGDFNGDGIVNAVDLNDLALNWRGGTIPASAVPEPTCVSLLATAGLAILLLARYRGSFF